MSTPENEIPKKQKLLTWKVILGFFVILIILGLFAGGTKSNDATPSDTSTNSTPAATKSADVGTHMACEHWRINLSNASVETTAQQIAGAQKVNEYASVSEIPEIVSSARSMTEALINQDAEAYLKYGTAFGTACQAAGE
jgi:hypothetical protein